VQRFPKHLGKKTEGATPASNGPASKYLGQIGQELPQKSFSLKQPKTEENESLSVSGMLQTTACSQTRLQQSSNSIDNHGNNTLFPFNVSADASQLFSPIELTTSRLARAEMTKRWIACLLHRGIPTVDLADAMSQLNSESQTYRQNKADVAQEAYLNSFRREVTIGDYTDY